MKHNFLKLLFSGLLLSGIISCQKEDTPELGDFPEDVTVVPTTPLRFFVSFDSTSEEDKQINIRFKDSISQYPSFFPDNAIHSINGVSNHGYESTADKYLSYYNSNDWPSSTSFTVAFWEKRDGRPESDAQFIFSIPSTGGATWAKSTMFLFFDHKGAGATNDSAVIKFMLADAGGDTWLTWEGATGRIAGVQDNKWHHLAFTYDEATSGMKLYVDGVYNSTKTWGTHGPLKIEASKVSGFQLGGKADVKTDWEWGQAWIGGLDQFRLYNKVLTAAEIQSLFTNKE